jgi:translation initiation factor 2 alpha subunit (eIF-2alpha)
MATSEKIRYYPNAYPEVGDMVMVKIIEIDSDLGIARAELLEYAGLVGMISFAELSRRRIRSIRDHLRLNQQEVVEVLQCNPKTHHIDLSKKHISSRDQEACQERLNKTKRVDTILRQVAATTNVPLSQLYPDLAWPFYDSASKYPHPYDAYCAVIRGIDVLSNLKAPPELVTVLTQAIQNKFNLAPQELRSHIQLRSREDWPNPYHLDIDQIKECLMKASTYSPPNEPIVIRLISSPEYQLSLTTIAIETGKHVLTSAMLAIQRQASQFGGECKIIKEPYVVTPDSRIISSPVEPAVPSDNTHADDADDENDADEDDEADEDDADTPNELAATIAVTQAKLDAIQLEDEDENEDEDEAMDEQMISRHSVETTSQVQVN